MNYSDLLEDHEYLVESFQIANDPSDRDHDYKPGLNHLKVLRKTDHATQIGVIGQSFLGSGNTALWVKNEWNLMVLEDITDQP